MLINSYSRDKTYQLLIYITVALFITTTYYNGSDWRTYELAYDDWFYMKDFHLRWGEGTSLIFDFFKYINFNFHSMLIVLKLVVFFACLYFLKSYSSDLPTAFMFFIMSAGYGLFIDNPLRQMLAMPFFLLALHYLYKRSLLPFVLTIAAGFTFHSSIVFMVPLFFVPKTKFSNLFYFILFIATFTFVYFFNYVTNVIQWFMNSIPVLDFYFRHYVQDSITQSSINGSSIVYIFISLLIFLIRSSKKYNINPSQFEFLAFIYILIVVLSIRIPDILRVGYYFSIPYALYVSDLSYFKRLSLEVFLIKVLQLVLCFNMLLFSYKYIPYTNYIYDYFLSDLKTYQYRDNFHFEYHNVER